jgi:hypothetical protein
VLRAVSRIVLIRPDYERETWEVGSAIDKEEEHTDRGSVTGSAFSQGARSRLSRRPPPGGEQTYGNEYWQDSNPLRPDSVKGSAQIRPAVSGNSLRSSFAPEQPRVGMPQSQYGAGSASGGFPAPGGNPFMGTAPPSMYDGHMTPMHTGNMMALNPFAASPMMAPYNPFTTSSMMNGTAPSMNPFVNPAAQPSPAPQQTQPIPAEPPTSYASDPTDDELFRVVDWYVRSNWQDENLTRRKVRDAVFAKFPEADLSARTTYINGLIDRAT